MDFTYLRDFQDRLTSWRIPGNDCMVKIGHETVYRYQSGFSNMEEGKKMQGDELYYLWSCSKPITCTLALKLYEQGLYLLNDPLYEYMPEFKDMTVAHKNEDGTTRLEPAKNPIRVRDLFTMSAGFTYNMNTPEIQAVKEATNGRCPTREIAKAVAKSPLQFEPGTRWSYSLCHDVLSAFIETVAGMRTRDWAKKVLFDPLGMDDTCYNLPSPEKMARMAVQYNFRDDLDKALPTAGTCGHMLGSEYDSGGAGIVSTIEDYMKFATAMANGGAAENGERVLASSTIDMMRTNCLNETQLKDFSWSQLCGYGYGLGVRTMIDPITAGTGGAVGEFGWGGAAGAYLILDPARKLAVVYAHHMLNNQEPWFSPRLRNVVYACLDR